jgi:hypothetical protein
MESVEIEIEVAVPTSEQKEVIPDLSLFTLLSRRSYCPGLVITRENGTRVYKQGDTLCEDGLPTTLLRWSDEGYAVA